MPGQVLIVDDDVNLLNGLRRALRKQMPVCLAEGGEEGLEILKTQGPFAVVISDQQMPGMDGIHFLKKVREASPSSVRIMLTGNADQQTAMAAVNEGHIFRFLSKPCTPQDLTQAILAAQRQYELVTAEKELLEKTLAGSVKVLVDVLSLRDPRSFAATGRIRKWARPLAKALAFQDGWTLDMAILLAPLGRITLPAQLVDRIHKSQSLSQTEKDLVGQTPGIARDLIRNIPRLEQVADAVYYQAKGYDGSGFPANDVSGNDIPMASRIIRLLTDLATHCEDGSLTQEDFDRLSQKGGHYDPSILATAQDVLLQGVSTDYAAPVTVHDIVRVHQLQPGDQLSEDLFTKDDTLLLARGQEVSAATIQKLRQFLALKSIHDRVAIIRLANASAAA